MTPLFCLTKNYHVRENSRELSEVQGRKMSRKKGDVSAAAVLRRFKRGLTAESSFINKKGEFAMLNSGSIAAGVVFNAMKKDSNIETMEAAVPECFCPMCKSNNIEISETFEDESGMTFFALKCSDCGTRFVLLEDLINSIRRKIENTKAAEKHYSEILEQFMEIDL